MTNQQALEALGMAERLLREAAEELKAAHTIGYLSEWDNGEPEVKAVYEEHIAAADGLAALSAAAPAVAHACCNSWFVSLREQGMLTEGSRHPQSWRCVALLADMGGEHADAAIDAAMLAAASQAPAAPFLDPDRARLDYLQEAGATVEILAGTPGHDFTFRVGGVYATRSGSIRAAIDLARATPKAGAQRETGGTDGQQT